jgi:hypothetical protein
MSTPLVQLTFALQSFEDPLSAAMRHTMEYEQLSLQANSLHCVTLQCLLPDDAHEGDIISLSATHPNARDAQYFNEKTLSQTDLDSGYVNLDLKQISKSHCFVMQMMLHGKHATLKDSIQFDMHINAYEQGFVERETPTAIKKHRSFRQYFSNMGSSLLSFF